MRIIMAGTGPFAVPTFRELLESSHEVVLLVTSPRRLCRGRPAARECPVRDVAAASGMPIFDPEDVNTPESVARLVEAAADVLVVCDYGQILSREALASARLGGINLHGSLLPKYRGAAPVAWAICHGETTTGVTVIHMTPTVDAGPCIAQASTPIGPDETAAELEARLCRLGGPLVLRTLDALAAGNVRPIEQDPRLASRAPRLKKEDGLIDWTRPAAAVKNHVRAMDPWPKAYTFWHRTGGEPARLILGPVTTVDSSGQSTPPGTVLEASGDRLMVAAGEGAVLLQSLQPAGKRMLPVDAFLRGYPVQPGERLGSV
ncbi:MAG TPA: methionyl-tRNA formyltransferase [Thermoguttaceae bacterium]|nr:methionyl-tRNA formyltransferase [Thermoguttaceae bacterium]